ncbi:DNA polymerase Y family protein [Methylobacillus flagellatus]|uniref:DNA polymerase Y family protein n=1 Tax=Methylobacillus flagellatus TaxID=405 RepID=UPI0010F7D82F|nr:DNA polymerase [Methylobacillus flagellatus]
MQLAALYLDFNSYFASVEQQMRPELRGKPIAVLPVVAETTCCIAASYEAKAFGVKTGTRVSDARKLCPDIIMVEGRPPLYVEFHHRLVEIVESCTHVERTLSIDEMVCMLTGSQRQVENALKLAAAIKKKIECEVGPYIRCSIGIAPNVFLAKVASNMQKPDGCVVLRAEDIPEKLLTLKLRDLNGIGKRMESRLMEFGIESVADLYAANRQQLRSAWGSVEGERMYDKLRGVQVEYQTHDRRSLGHSHVLPPELRNAVSALSVLHRLLQKAAMRMRSYGLQTSSLSVRVKFLNASTWVAETRMNSTDDTLILTATLEQLWRQYPKRKYVPYAVGISFTSLNTPDQRSMSLFSEVEQGSKLNGVLDALNSRFGKNTVYLGRAHDALKHAPMRIAFNHIPDLKTESDE